MKTFFEWVGTEESKESQESTSDKSHRPILDFLHSIKPSFSWERMFPSGRIRVNSSFVTSNYQIKPGDRVVFDPFLRLQEPPVDRRLTILYEDEYFVVINKPTPLPIHPSGKYLKNSLTGILKERKLFWHTIHRIDSETSGVLLLVKDANLVVPFSKALRSGSGSGSAQKSYLVMVYGKTKPRFEVEMLLGRRLGGLVYKRQGHNPEGKTSYTRFTTLKTWKAWMPPLTEEHTHSPTPTTPLMREKMVWRSLVLAQPQTGRTHQIRAHLAETGWPVVGDKIYGLDESYFLDFLDYGMSDDLYKKLELKRQFLHAYKLAIVHPVTGARLLFKAPLPVELRNYLNALDNYSP